MRTTFHLRVWTRFLAPGAEVWKLKTDLAALSAEFRPWAAFGGVDPGALNGPVPSQHLAKLRPLGLPGGFAWPLTLEVVEPEVRFRDTSTSALFSRFEHDHVFEPTPDGCRYIDVVTFTPTFPAQKLAAIMTRRMFVHHHTVAAKRLPTDPQATAVGMLRVMVEEEADPE